MNPNTLHQMSSLHRHWKNQAKGSAKHVQIEAEDRRAYKEETVTSHTVYDICRLRPQIADCKLRNGPDKNDSNNGNEHVGMQKKVLTFLLSVLTSDWLKQQKLTKLHKAVHIFILTFQPSSI